MCVCVWVKSVWGVLLQSNPRQGSLIRLLNTDGLFSVITMLFIRFHHISSFSPFSHTPPSTPPYLSCTLLLINHWRMTGGRCDWSEEVIASQVCWYGDCYRFFDVVLTGRLSETQHSWISLSAIWSRVFSNHGFSRSLNSILFFTFCIVFCCFVLFCSIVYICFILFHFIFQFVQYHHNKVAHILIFF